MIYDMSYACAHRDEPQVRDSKSSELLYLISG